MYAWQRALGTCSCARGPQRAALPGALRLMREKKIMHSLLITHPEALRVLIKPGSDIWIHRASVWCVVKTPVCLQGYLLKGLHKRK